ncbi:GntR family transcriptional regulator [Lachnospiraceae bacterium PM6-15]|uniref:GntR family transcriptional regulator n=1 Tax=Ohessyouella blattaphilus TaxID=2949333 RepID=UPI003E2850B7
MYIEIDFNSPEAIYIQLRNQIITEIAFNNIKDGDSLPSVRQLADTLGINMHTVNKAYSLLKVEGYIRLDRRRGAVIAVSDDKEELKEEIRQHFRMIVARSNCKNICRLELQELLNEVFAEFE